VRNSYAAFIFASAFAYFAGIALVFLGYPPILNMHPFLQAVAFLFMGLLSLVANSDYEGVPLLHRIRELLAMMWGAMAAFTFVGFVVWAPAGDPASRLFMTLWDLALAICVLDDK
jgi:hypothetical protein